MKRKLITLLLTVSILPLLANVWEVSEDLEVHKITEKVYVHISYRMTDEYGRVEANGFFIEDKGEVFLFDTPWRENQTEDLLSFISDSLGFDVVGFVPNHWHVDCMGGLGIIQNFGIQSYAHNKTIELAEEKELPVPQKGFEDSLILKVGETEVKCFFLGASHTMDNIVTWVPSEKLLFAGCMLKGTGANNLGYTADGDVSAYPATLNRIKEKFSDADIVIPGHGMYCNFSIVEHMIELANQTNK